MQRLTIVTVLLVLMANSIGCRHGVRTWGLRGARCAPAYAAPMYAAPAPTVVESPPCGINTCPPAVYGEPAVVMPQDPYAPPATIETIPEATTIPGSVPGPVFQQ